MDRQTKHNIVGKLREELQGVESVFLCNFNGLTVEKDTQLRRTMRESGSNYTVYKNTLLKLAFIDSDFSQIDDKLVGNTALVYSREDTVALAKIIRDFAKDNQAFEFKAGVVEGKVIDAAELDALASLPSKEVLVSKLMYMLNFPIQGLVTTLSGVSRKLVVALDQIRQQKEQSE
jgi:large subunit ribosomal protein L10